MSDKNNETPTVTSSNSYSNMSEEEREKDPGMWSTEQEQLLANWSERACAYSWMHSRAHSKYRSLSMAIQLPIIVLSTFSGVGNFGLSSFLPIDEETGEPDESAQQIGSSIIGSMNIFCGLLGTLASYFNFSELSEAHKQNACSFSKFARHVSTELAISPVDREPPLDFLKFCRQHYDTLLEQSATIPHSVIKRFLNKFPLEPDPNHRFSRPDIANGISKVRIYGDKTRVMTPLERSTTHMNKAMKKWNKRKQKFGKVKNIEKGIEENGEFDSFETIPVGVDDGIHTPPRNVRSPDTKQALDDIVNETVDNAMLQGKMNIFKEDED